MAWAIIMFIDVCVTLCLHYATGQRDFLLKKVRKMSKRENKMLTVGDILQNVSRRNWRRRRRRGIFTYKTKVMHNLIKKGPWVSAIFIETRHHSPGFTRTVTRSVSRITTKETMSTSHEERKSATFLFFPWNTENCDLNSFLSIGKLASLYVQVWVD